MKVPQEHAESKYRTGTISAELILAMGDGGCRLSLLVINEILTLLRDMFSTLC